MVEVLTLRIRSGTAFIEWFDGGVPYRGYVPQEQVVNGHVSKDNLAVALPHGLPWGELVEFDLLATRLTEQLYKAGVWSAEDLQSSPVAANAAIRNAVGLTITDLLSKVHELEVPETSEVNNGK
jgi:hypothetical protein